MSHNLLVLLGLFSPFGVSRHYSNETSSLGGMPHFHYCISLYPSCTHSEFEAAIVQIQELILKLSGHQYADGHDYKREYSAHRLGQTTSCAERLRCLPEDLKLGLSCHV
jgi:hypothetical protein